MEAALAEYPENLHLMYVRASLEEVVYGGEVALHTARQMFTLWQKLYKEQLMTDISDVQSQHHANHDTHSMFNLSDKDTGMAYTSSFFSTTSPFCTYAPLCLIDNTDGIIIEPDWSASSVFY